MTSKVLQSIAQRAAKFCGAQDVQIHLVDGAVLRCVADHGDLPAPAGRDLIPVSADFAAGKAVLTRQTFHLRGLASPRTKKRSRPARDGYHSILVAPLMRNGAAIGTLSLGRRQIRGFSDKQVELLKTFANEAAITIENTRLVNERKTYRRALTESLEQQAATSEILRVISNSPTDLQRVLNAVAERAARLCGANDCQLQLVEGSTLRRVAKYGEVPTVSDGVFPIVPGLITGRAVLERRIFHIEDVASVSEDEFPDSKRLQRSGGYRTLLVVPLVREGIAIGAINIRRMEVSPFTDKQVQLVQTFADQAVIAIENTRLFNELQERLEQQTATSEILRVISQSQRDVQPVFDAIAANARKLSGAAQGGVFTFDGELVHYCAATWDGLSGEGIEVTHRKFPMRLSRGSGIARSILDRQVVYMPDVLADAEYRMHDLARVIGVRSQVSVPMLRDGAPIGVVNVFGSEPGMFTDRQIAMLQTFADQAVIAIENTRLFNELQERLEQQTATSEILRVISQSQRDVQPVFEAIAANARRLCRGTSGWVNTFDGELIKIAAVDGVSPAGFEANRQMYPMPPGRGSANQRAILTRAVCYVPDIREDPEYRQRDLAQTAGFLSALSVPMLRDGSSIGVITVTGAEPAMFSERQIAMLQTFADQAVIAIENARLFDELQTRNKDLTEALEQQTATSEILRVISQSQRDVQPVFETIAVNAQKLCKATFGGVWTYDGRLLDLVALEGFAPEAGEAIRRAFPRPPGRGGAHQRAILSRKAVYIADVREDPEFELQDLANVAGFRSSASVPMLREGQPIGTIGVAGAEPAMFSERQIAMLQTFADQAVIAIENTRLFNELQTRNRDLTEALEQQTATSEILRVISQSHRDVQPVFEAIAASARKLCEANSAMVSRFDGDLVHVAASEGTEAEGLDIHRRVFPIAPSGGTASGRAIESRSVVHIPDVDADAGFRFRDQFIAANFRSVVAVPMIREGTPIGTVNVTGARPAMFSERQIAMLKTFADQAVIAIENSRLFNELEARTAELSRSVEELKALGEVGSALSSTLDVDTVLTTILTRANQLAGTQAGQIYDYDDATEELRPRATVGYIKEIDDAVRRSPLRKGEGVTGQSVLKKQPIQVTDITVEGAYESRLRDLAIESGFRAVLAVPLVREDQVMGALTIARNQAGEFPPEVIQLMTTFASQSALAMQNARLFHQLQVASKHKSQFLANMSHELRTPLNAILGYTELIVDQIYGEVPEKIKEVLDRVQRSGRHLLGLINDVLDLSKIEAGQLVLTLSAYSFGDVVQAVVSAVGSLAAEKQLRLTVDPAPDLPVAQGDERRITQVLLNLVGNAIKFTERGEVAVRVSIADGAFLVAVSDTGPGIRQEDREKIFEEFQQSDTAVARTKSGTGLGLAIAKRIVELHGGRIWVESTLGEGSTFFVSLPITAARKELAA
ncbi:MAG TPA: GAF domain-containing protein [Burkholderiales bacterium]|nr:GAF domain-containing protein [Burkholderiales bacterium]